VELAESHDHWRFEGLANVCFLALILGAVFLEKPLFLREALMVAAAIGSYFTTRKPVHQANQFNFHPIQEVAILFAGIFATMMPALDWLRVNAATLGNPTPAFFYWGSGTLSSVLDNLSSVIRERFKVKRQVKVISAHGRMTALVLSLLPPFVGLAQMVIAPDNFKVLFTDPMGIKMLVAALVLQGIGMLVIRKIVNTEY